MAKKEKLSDSVIVRYIDILEETFGGVRPDISKEKLEYFLEPFVKKNYSESILRIKTFLCLPMTLRIGYIRENNIVNKETKNFLEDVKNFLIYFLKSKNPSISNYRILKKKNFAFVSIPERLPLYGQKEFEEITITMHLRLRIFKEPFETFVYMMSHEFSHIILDSLDHKLKDSEIATDLSAMILGFSRVMSIGRNGSVFDGWRYIHGYLDDRQFDLAYKVIKNKQRKQSV